MAVFKGLKNCIAFLTRIPIKKEVDIIQNIATKTWLFPAVGFLIGLISSLIGTILFNLLPNLIVGFMLLGSILFVSGAHHLDGLIDFGDGLMAMGPQDHKIKVMHDVSIGAGGFSLGLIVMILTGLSLGCLKDLLIIAFILSEVVAKLNIVAACSIGKSAGTPMAEPFIAQTNKKHLIVSALLSIFLITFSVMLQNFNSLSYKKFPGLSILITQTNFLDITFFNIFILIIILAISSIIPLLITIKLANKHFNGLTGDCLGALNEITRMFSLIVFISFMEAGLI
ncbi:MAG: adenosylcobinamide-GDP ribazoletransferase [Candidatus Lokiarchaeota archaeon]|nr:adenosylcobinamide-GDP ribazoletransferase [Candidatus Lokiarchaeota archaeon]